VRVEDGRLVRPFDDHDGRVLIGFDQLDGQCVYGGYLACGQSGYVAHWDLAPHKWDSWPVGSCTSWRAAQLTHRVSASRAS
jgi:hypothetical protein